MDDGDEGQAVMLPRLGGHLRIWGHGHWCSSDEPHDDCFCICGMPAGYDDERLCGPEQPQERERSQGNENLDRDA
jgi:hypothetical protein